jgi:hypothetical protein
MGKHETFYEPIPGTHKIHTHEISAGFPHMPRMHVIYLQYFTTPLIGIARALF